MTPGRGASGDDGRAGSPRAGGAPDSPAAPRRSLLRTATATAALGVAGMGAPGLGAAPTSPGHAASLPQPTSFAFALIGDLPYSDGDEAQLATMLARLDDEPLAFVVHVGDIKGGREPCSDALFERRRALLARSAHPLVLLPGDNEWVDCHRAAAGAHDPRERLAALRRTFWSSPDPLGREPAAGRAALGLERQKQAPENVRWRIGAVHFAGLHVVGSNNGLGEYPGSRAEFEARQALNRIWLDEWAARARRERADALVLAIHADPEFGRQRKDGFATFLGWLQDLAAGFAGPILLAHGDSHRFRVDQPLLGRDGRPAANLTRVECFGHPFIHSWVRIGYDRGEPGRFSVGVREIRAMPP